MNNKARNRKQINICACGRTKTQFSAMCAICHKERVSSKKAKGTLFTTKEPIERVIRDVVIEGRRIRLAAFYDNWLEWADGALHRDKPLQETVQYVCEGLNTLTDNADKWTPNQVKRFAQSLRLRVEQINKEG